MNIYYNIIISNLLHLLFANISNFGKANNYIYKFNLNENIK